MNKRKAKKYLLIVYELSFCILAIVAVALAIIDLSKGLLQWQSYLDTFITVLFVIDYFLRLVLAQDKRHFVVENVFDLIAIIPFSSLFKIFRLLKFLKVLKFIKLVRFSAYFARLYKHTKLFFNITGFKYMVIASAFCISAGGILIHFFEDMSFSDGIWWAFVTATTVGYGDISPSTISGRIIAAVLMLVGIGLIGSLTSTITALFFQKSDNAKKNTKNKLLEEIQYELDDFDNLTDNDIETICQILYVLKRDEKS